MEGDEMKKLLFTLALAPALVFARPHTLIIAADGDASWTKTVREHMLPGREAHVHDFGKNTIAETLSSCGWKEFLADINDFAVVNKVMQELVPQPFPARSCFAVAALPKGALVEVEAIAEIP